MTTPNRDEQYELYAEQVRRIKWAAAEIKHWTTDCITDLHTEEAQDAVLFGVLDRVWTEFRKAMTTPK